MTAREQIRAAYKASIDRMLHLPEAQRAELLESMVADAMEPPAPAPEVSPELAALRQASYTKTFEE